MRDHPRETEKMPDARSSSHLFLYAASAYAIYNLLRPLETHTPERWRVERQRGAGRLPNHRPIRSTTRNEPLRQWSVRMEMPARLHAHQRRRPHNHRHGPSARQYHHPNTNIHSASRATPPTTHAAPPRSGGHHHAPPTNLYFDERMGGLWAGAPSTARAQTPEGARAG